MKIDLEIDEKIPQDVREIILRAESDLHNPAINNAHDRMAQIVSQMIQQAYYLGCLEGNKRTNAMYTDLLKGLGKAVLS